MLTLPKTVGSRELKTRLGTYLRLVRDGARFVVTDRGRPVAELGPILLQGDDLGERLYDLAAAGVIGQEISERKPLPKFEPIQLRDSDPLTSDMIIDDREERL